MDKFKSKIKGFHKAGMHMNVHRGGPCSCCTEADKRTRSRLARHRLAQDDESSDDEIENYEEEE